MARIFSMVLVAMNVILAKRCVRKPVSVAEYYKIASLQYRRDQRYSRRNRKAARHSALVQAPRQLTANSIA